MGNRLAVYGGTFNPIHNGHLHLCMECQRQLHFDRILLMPANLPPHKEAVDLADNRDRYEMCRIAARAMPELEACDLELRLSGVSYTVHTLRELHRREPGQELFFLLGSDMLYSFHRWYRYREILSLATIVAGAREQEEYDRMLAYRDTLGELGSRVQVLRLSALPLSSTEIRQALRRGDASVRQALPPGVAEYIEAHGLYRTGTCKEAGQDDEQ